MSIRDHIITNNIRSNLLKKIKLYLNSNNRNLNLNAYSSHTYFSSSEDTLGNSKMNYWIKKSNNKYNYFFDLLKNFLSISYRYNYQLKYDPELGSYKYILITWALRKNFRRDGSLDDRYFNVNSKRYKNVLWYVIYLDDQLPNKLDKNIVIIYNNNSKIPNPFYLIKYIAKLTIEEKFNLRNIFHKLSFQTFFAFVNLNKIKIFMENENLKKIIMPYEGQPFQNLLCSEAKNINNSVKTAGYVSHTHPFQLDIFYREGAPDDIYIHSENQLKFFQKYLNWPKKKINLISSLRYQDDKKSSMHNKIFFPYKIKNHKKILQSLDQLFDKSKKKSFPTFTLVTHPAPYNQKSQNKLKSDISQILIKYKDRFHHKNKRKISVVIGLSTSLFLALEKRVEVIHISVDSVFDSLTKSYWPNVIISPKNKNTYLYRLNKYGKCIKFGKRKNLFNNYFLNV